MSFVKSIKERWSTRPTPPEFPIILTASGFVVGASDGSSTEVHWKSIKEVRALKLELLTLDEVRFVFLLSSGVTVEVSEEQPGFSEMLIQAVHHMPTIEGWQSVIIKPTFARNETVLFRSEAQQGIQPDGPASAGSSG